MAIAKARHAPILIGILPDVLADDRGEGPAGRTMDRLWDAIDSLRRADQRILIRRYGLDGRPRWTREEIADRHGLTVYAVKGSLKRSLAVIGESLRDLD